MPVFSSRVSYLFWAFLPMVWIVYIGKLFDNSAVFVLLLLGYVTLYRGIVNYLWLNQNDLLRKQYSWALIIFNPFGLSYFTALFGKIDGDLLLVFAINFGLLIFILIPNTSYYSSSLGKVIMILFGILAPVVVILSKRSRV